MTLPNKFMEDAAKILKSRGCEITYDTYYHYDMNWRDIQLLQEAIAQALTAAEERGRKAGLEEAAKVAYNPDYMMGSGWRVQKEIAEKIRALK